MSWGNEDSDLMTLPEVGVAVEEQKPNTIIGEMSDFELPDDNEEEDLDEFDEEDFDHDFDDDFEEEAEDEYEVDNEEFPASDFDDGTTDFSDEADEEAPTKPVENEAEE